MFYATTDAGKSKSSKSVVELSNWAKEEKAELLMVRRFDQDGSVQIQPVLVYEFVNGRPVRIW
jgi:hypothetical protein